ncbi:MAG: exopolysaccharide biosynthesis protein [Pseudomonadota bacterium]
MGDTSAPPRERLTDILQDVRNAGCGDVVSVADILSAVGRRSFGALLLVPSILVVSPFSGIPGVPTTAALVIVLICAQYIVGRREVWLPRFVLRRSMSRARLNKAIDTASPIIGRLDRLVKPRWTFLLGRLSIAALAVVIALLALTLPPLEILPFVSTTTGIIIALLSLALLARDGLLALLALALTTVLGTTLAVVVLPAVTTLFT